MISIDEALSAVLQRVCPNEPVQVELEHVVGKTLATDFCYDIDSPPYDKALMDGYAVRVADVVRGRARLEVLEQVTAGSVPRLPVRPATAVQIMTGAPLPQGADAVVMVERTTSGSGIEGGSKWVEVDDPTIVVGQNILRRGMSAQCGELVLGAGHRLRARDVGVLCETGCTILQVIRPPRVTVLATGNELVPPEARPGPGQIRNTNGPLLAALVRQLHAECRTLPICRDDPKCLDAAIPEGLNDDIMLLAGGVSAGVLDLVPAALEKAGIEPVFHKVFVKPGKPFWFGMRTDDGHRTLVFGLPGNPVGCLVCFLLFVRPAIRAMLGQDPNHRATRSASLGCDYDQLWDRPTYYPVVVASRDEHHCVVTPIRWQGSADLRAIARADGFAFFPPGKHTYRAGHSVDVLFMEEIAG